MRHYENPDERQAFARGYEQGVRDASGGATRQLCETPAGRRPPVVKSDGSAYFHGYKAGSRGQEAPEAAFEHYREKHHRPNGDYHVDLSLQMGHQPNGRGGISVRKVDEKIYAASAMVPGERGEMETHFRIDGRGGTWRVDRKILPVEPWEAIDGGDGFASLAAAKRFLAEWVHDRSTLFTEREAHEALRSAGFRAVSGTGVYEDEAGRKARVQVVRYGRTARDDKYRIERERPRSGAHTPNAREPDPVILVEYGVLENDRGWYPMVWENGQKIRSWDPHGWDRDDAMREARRLATEDAAHWIGDWDVRIEEQIDQLKDRLKHAPRGELVMTMIDGKEAAIRNTFGPAALAKLTPEDVRRVAVY